VGSIPAPGMICWRDTLRRTSRVVRQREIPFGHTLGPSVVARWESMNPPEFVMEMPDDVVRRSSSWGMHRCRVTLLGIDCWGNSRTGVEIHCK
jgi:hypothetical protein